MLETVVVIAVIGTITAVAYPMFGFLQSKSKEEKIKSDVATINRAIQTYLASGGSLSLAKSEVDVIKKLRSVASPDTAKTLPGLTSSFVDPRLSIRYQTKEEVDSKNLRAVWSADERRFILTRSDNVSGIKEFYLDKTVSPSDHLVEDRSSVVSFSPEGWIWKYKEDDPPVSPPKPTVFATSLIGTVNPPSVAAMAGSTVPLPPVSAPTIELSAPTFSIPSGNYPMGDFDMEISLINTNPAGSSLIYSVDFGPWLAYTGSLLAKPDSVVKARAVPSTSGYSASPISQEHYQVNPVQLVKPVIYSDFDSFGLFSQNNVTISIANLNDPAISMIEYWIGSGPWQPYTGSFQLPSADYKDGANIEARAVSSGPPFYLTSPSVTLSVPVEGLNLSGTTTGTFHDPMGPSGMVTSLKESSSYFEWGDATPLSGHTLSESWMRFTGGTYHNITDGALFSIGSLEYYNGTIRSGTEADSVYLDIALNLNLDGTVYRPYFDFKFDLINTVNTTDEWASADYVLLPDSRSSRTIVINGYEFEFNLQFGETTAHGISQFNEFHVLEQKSASTNLYGMFNLLGLASANPPPANIVGSAVAAPSNGGKYDPAVVTDFLADIATENEVSARSARDAAKTAMDAAVTAKNAALQKYNEESYNDVADLADSAALAAQEAENRAAEAENAAIIARNQATQAVQIAASDSSAQSGADNAVAFAAKAEDYASEARTDAQAAVQAAIEASQIAVNAGKGK